MNKQAPLDFVEQYYVDDLAERNTLESSWSLAWLKEIQGENILSLGCGPNFYDDAQFFANIPDKFVGVDLNENNITFLKQSTHPEIIRNRKILENNHTKVSLLTADIRKEQKEFINYFDAVYAIGVLGMFQEEDITKLFKLIYSYLKPGGKLIDIDWTDERLSKEKLKERESYGWYSTQGPDIARVGELMKIVRFKIKKHSVYTVADPVAYSWGKIYGYVAEK